MSKTTKTTYFVPISLGAGGSWGSGYTFKKAINNACREARDFAEVFGGFKADARLNLIGFEIPAGHYAYWDSRGVFVVEYDSDTIVGYALPAYRAESVNPADPLAAEPLDLSASEDRAKIERLNAAGDHPTDKVA